MDAQTKLDQREHLEGILDIGLRRCWKNVLDIVYTDPEKEVSPLTLDFDPPSAINRVYHLTDREITITVKPSDALRHLGAQLNADALAHVKGKLWHKALHWAAGKVAEKEQLQAAENKLILDHQRAMGNGLADRAMQVLEQGMRLHLQEIKELLSPEGGAQFERMVHLVPCVPCESKPAEHSRKRARRQP